MILFWFSCTMLCIAGQSQKNDILMLNDVQQPRYAMTISAKTKSSKKETKRYTKGYETKRNETKRNETKRNETKEKQKDHEMSVLKHT
jgi:hypothetical protein